MADIDFGNDVANNLATRMLMTDANLQASHPNWPTGGTAAQIGIESNGNNNAVSPAGAVGLAQFEPKTFDAVAKQMGRKMDIHNVQDQMDAHQYLMMQNLDRTGGDVNGALSLYNSGRATPDNPETHNYISKFAQHTGGGVDPSKIDFGDSPSTNVSTPPASKAPEIDFGDKPEEPSALENAGNWLGDKASGIGQVAAQMGTGMVGQAAGGLRGLYDLATGNSAHATSDINATENALTYQPRTETGKAMANTVNQGIDKYVTQPLNKGGETAISAIPFIGEDLAKGGYAKDIAEVGTGIFENFGLPGLLHEAGGALKGRGAPLDSAAKLAPDDAAAPSATMQAPNMGPNEGPQRPPIVVDSQGNAVDPLSTDPNMQAYVRAAQEQQAQAQRMGQQAAPGYGPPQNFDTMGPNSGPQLPPVLNPREVAQGEFNGPPRPAISVNSQGVAVDPLGDANMAQYVQEAQQRIAFQNGDLFPNEAGGEASPYNPNRLSSEVQEPFTPSNAKNLRQGELNLQNEEPVRYGTQRGDVGTAEQLADQGYRAAVQDPIVDRMQMMREATPDQLDIFKDTTQPQESAMSSETGRSMSPDEFARTVAELNAKDGTRFPLPEDMHDAYSKYIETIHDDQGGLFDKPTVAKNFTDMALQDSITRRIQEHPTVQANAAKAAQAKATADTLGTGSAQAAYEQARATLQKSVDNIGSHFKEAAKQLAPWEKDGVVYMHTFGDLSTLMKSIGAVLKGIHGVVFKTLDRVARRYDNLDSAGKILGQGIKDAISRQANRDWSQTVNERPINQMKGVPGLREAVQELNPHAQESLSPAELKAQFNSASDLTTSKIGNAMRNNLLQGGLMISDFSRHPLVKYTTDAVANAYRSADAWTRQNLLNPKTGLRPLMKALGTQEFTEMRTLMEAYEGVKEFSPSELKGKGFTDKQVAYYQRSLELQKDAFNKFNAGRQRAGLPAVDPRIAHIASYFTGDFRIQVKDSAGRLIAVLGHNNRAALNVIANRFKEMHPDGASLEMGKPQLSRMVGGTDGQFTGFMNVLNELSKTNADVSRIVDAYRDTAMANTNKLSQMANRGKFKSNAQNTVGGAEGSKLWQSMEKNAQEGGKQQLKYLESVNKWSEFQQAIEKAQAMISDPEVNAPNAKGVSQAYLDNQMHRNLGDLNTFTNSFVNGIAEVTGVGPSQMRSMANLTKTGLLNMFVGLGKFSHSLVTLLQPLQGIPEVNSVLKARGADLGKTQVLSIFKSMMDNKDILQSMATGQTLKDPFVRAANEYARANDTFNTSQYQMGSITHPASNLGTAMHINVTVPESGTRAFTYMYYARMLKDADVKGTMTDKEIFGTAHNAVQKVMADYSQEAGAAIYNKLGFLGGLAKMLTTFKLNQVSQYATAGKMFSQGTIAPMVTMLATSLASGGLRGFIGYNIANGLLGQVSTWATKNGLMSQPTNLDQIVLHMLHGMNKGLADALNFGATSALGIDMTGSFSHADDIPDDPLGTLLPQGEPISKALTSVAKAVQHPNKQNAMAAGYDLLPNSMKGIMENQAYTDDKGRYYDPHTGNLVATRTPADQMKRNFSFRPLEESKMRLQAEVSKGHEQQLGAVKSEIITRALSDADSNGGKVPNIQAYAQAYIKAGGDPQELVNKLVQHNGLNKNRDIGQREEGIPTGGFTAGERYQRSQGYK